MKKNCTARKLLQKMLLGFLFCFTLLISIETKAEENSEESVVVKNQMMTTNQEVNALESPDENAVVVMSFEKGAPVIVVGEAENGWYKISYQNKVCYIKQGYIDQQGVNEQLEKEIQEINKENKMVIEVVEKYRAEARRSKIWGTVIVLLIIAIFGVGIASTVMNERKNKLLKIEKLNGEVERSEEVSRDYLEENELDIIDLEK